MFHWHIPKHILTHQMVNVCENLFAARKCKHINTFLPGTENEMSLCSNDTSLSSICPLTGGTLFYLRKITLNDCRPRVLKTSLKNSHTVFHNITSTVCSHAQVESHVTSHHTSRLAAPLTSTSTAHQWDPAYRADSPFLH